MTLTADEKKLVDHYTTPDLLRSIIHRLDTENTQLQARVRELEERSSAANEILQTYCDFIDDYCMETYGVKEGEPFKTIKEKSQALLKGDF